MVEGFACFVLFCFVFLSFPFPRWDFSSLCSPDYPGMHSVGKAGLKLTEIHLFLHPVSGRIKGVFHSCQHPAVGGFDELAALGKASSAG